VVLREQFVLAVAGARAYKLRSVLALLGLGWGLACFLILLSAAQAVGQALQDVAALWGRNVVYLSPGRASARSGVAAGRALSFDRRDLDRLRARAVLSHRVTPVVMRRGRLEYAGRALSAGVLAVVPDEYTELLDLPLAGGRWLDAEDVRQRRNAIVLGQAAAQRLFGDRPALDRIVRVDGVPFVVVGSLRRRGPAPGHEVDREVFVPLGLRGDDTLFTHLLLQPVTLERHAAAVRQAVELLADLHGVSCEDPEAVLVRDRISTLRTFARLRTGFTLVWGLIGAVTLAVGGVSLANVMLVSVVERTREIGVRRAVGARRADVRAEFLIEALLIAAAGGVAGALLAAVVCPLIPPLSLPTGSVPVRLRLAAVAPAAALLAAVAVAAGAWPAQRAARLAVQEALRTE
jgi:putative ABC transport system permease protein